MRNYRLFLVFLFFNLILNPYRLQPAGAQTGSEEITITTYYPSPNGSYKELTTTDNTYLATEGGRVGIGTSTPGSMLTVRGSGNLPTTSGLNVTNSAGTSALFVNDFGRVGIGTAAPTENLHISGNSTFTREVIENTNSTNIAVFQLNNDTGFATPFFFFKYGSAYAGTAAGLSCNNLNEIGGYGGPLLLNHFTAGQPIVFGTNNTERMRVGGTGNVGIGTTNPVRTLHVSGSAVVASAARAGKIDLGTDAFNYIRSDANGLYLGAYNFGAAGGADWVTLRNDSLGTLEVNGGLRVRYSGTSVQNLNMNNWNTIVHNLGVPAGYYQLIMVINGDYDANPFSVMGAQAINSNSFKIRVESKAGGHGGLARFNWVIFVQ